MELGVEHLLMSRGLHVPQEDVEPLEQHWDKMRQLRARVDEATLADHEIAVTWSAVAEEEA